MSCKSTDRNVNINLIISLNTSQFRAISENILKHVTAVKLKAIV